MLVELKVPEVGESITEGFLSRWLVADGSVVRPETELFELETDKVTMPVPAGHAGRLRILVQADQDVNVGQVVGTIDTAVVDDEVPSAEANLVSEARRAASVDPTPVRAPPPPPSSPHLHPRPWRSRRHCPPRWRPPRTSTGPRRASPRPRPSLPR